MAIIPGGKRFIGISENVDLTEKKSALINSKTEPYTMSDIVDTVAASGGGGKFVDGTNPLDAVYTTGDVGIGTTTPSQALDVVGKISLNDGGNSVYLGGSAGTNDAGTNNNRNVGIGTEALNLNTTGVSNIAIGYQSLRLNTNGAQNASVGTFSLWSNVGGISNTAIGYQSLFFNTTGNNNVASGYRSLRSNTAASSNVAIGYEALIDTTIGDNNVALGTQAGDINTTGANNVFLGTESGPLSVNQSNQIVIGYQAIGNGSNTVTIGNTSIVATVLRGTLNLANLPTSATGLSAGDVWRSGNDLKIV